MGADINFIKSNSKNSSISPSNPLSLSSRLNKNNSKHKWAFTLAEAILTMTIIGVIAATMVTVLKPQQYKAQSFLTLKQKTYIALDEAIHTSRLHQRLKSFFTPIKIATGPKG